MFLPLRSPSLYSNPTLDKATRSFIDIISDFMQMQSTQLFFWLLLGSLLPILLNASAVLPRDDDENGAKDISADGTIGVGAMAATAISLISKHNKESKITDKVVEAPSTPHAAIQLVINDMHSRNKSITLVAVKLFTLVTGQDTLGVSGKDWGSVWIPVQPSVSSPIVTYVVWWTKKRGATLMINNPASPDDWAVSKGVKVGIPIGPNIQIVYT